LELSNRRHRARRRDARRRRPDLLGGGERLLADDLVALGYEIVEHVPPEAVTHVSWPAAPGDPRGLSAG
jgi:hypothetical protein